MLYCVLNIVYWSRFFNDNIHTRLKSSLDINWFTVASYTNYKRLLTTIIFNEFTDVLSWLIPIHFWHIAIHKNNRIKNTVRKFLFKLFKGNKTIASWVDLVLEIESLWRSCDTLENYFETTNDEWFIVDNHYMFFNRLNIFRESQILLYFRWNTFIL